MPRVLRQRGCGARNTIRLSKFVWYSTPWGLQLNPEHPLATPMYETISNRGSETNQHKNAQLEIIGENDVQQYSDFPRLEDLHEVDRQHQRTPGLPQGLYISQWSDFGTFCQRAADDGAGGTRRRRVQDDGGP